MEKTRKIPLEKSKTPQKNPKKRTNLPVPEASDIRAKTPKRLPNNNSPSPYATTSHNQNPLPAKPDEKGEIDCLHPNAPKQSELGDPYYNNEPDEEESKFLLKEIPNNKRQRLHFQIRAICRFQKKNYHRALCGISSHYFIAIVPNENMTPIKDKIPPKYLLLCRFHVMTIKKFYFGKNYQGVTFFCIRLTSFWENKVKYKPQIIIESKGILPFARICVRNFDLAYSTAYCIPQMEIPQELHIDPESYCPEEFPRFNAGLSPSQQFQFTYFALCSMENELYNHDIVRYFHYQVVLNSGIFNVAHLPIDYQMVKDDGNRSELIPIFRALIYIPYIFGIVCSRITRPDIFRGVSFLLMLSKSIRFLFLSDCGAKYGLQSIASALLKNPECPIEYLDFSYNELADFDGFFQKVFQQRKSPIWYINFNFCKLGDKSIVELFDSLKEGNNSFAIKYLHLAGSDIKTQGLQAMDSYFTACSSHDSNKIQSLDFSEVNGTLPGILSVVYKHSLPLQSLTLANTQINEESYITLCNIISDTPQLYSLNISGSGLSPEQVARIIVLMSNRPGANKLSLGIDRLGIYGNGLISVIKGFLNGKIERWEKLSLSSNSMKVVDLQILVALLTRMPNLIELSLSDNFDSSMVGIETELCDLLRIPNLKVLNLAGSSTKSLKEKAYPLVFAIALSYSLRKQMGGYPARESIPDLIQFESNLTNLVDPFLKTNCKSQLNDLNSVKKRMSDILIPYLIMNSQLKSKQSIMDSKINIIETLVPLLKTVAKSLTMVDINTQYTKYLGAAIIPFFDITKQHYSDSSLSVLLSDKITETLLSTVSNLGAIEILNIRKNKIGDIGVNAICELLKVNSEIKGVDIDGSGLTTISQITEFVNVCASQNHLTRIQFPVIDAKNIIKTSKKQVHKVVERNLASEQMRLTKEIDEHRILAGECADLPFDVVPDLGKTINDLVSLNRDYFNEDTIREHSGIIEHFGLTLPYLESDIEDSKLPDNYQRVDIGKLECYLAPSMKKRYIEEGNNSNLKPGMGPSNLRRRQVGGADQTDSEVIIFDHSGIDISDVQSVQEFAPIEINELIPDEEFVENNEEEQSYSYFESDSEGDQPQTYSVPKKPNINLDSDDDTPTFFKLSIVQPKPTELEQTYNGSIRKEDLDYFPSLSLDTIQPPD